MKPIACLATAFLLWANPIRAGEPQSFKAAKPLEIGKSNSEEMSVRDRLILRLPEGFLVLSFSDPTRVDKDGSLTESCRIHWLLMGPDGVSDGRQESKIEYKVTVEDQGKHSLETIAGTQEFSKGGAALSWSFRSDDRVYVYPAPGCLYAILKGEPTAQ